MGNGFRDLIATEESLLLGLPPRTQLMDMIYPLYIYIKSGGGLKEIVKLSVYLQCGTM